MEKCTNDPTPHLPPYRYWANAVSSEARGYYCCTKIEIYSDNLSARSRQLYNPIAQNWKWMWLLRHRVGAGGLQGAFGLNFGNDLSIISTISALWLQLGIFRSSCHRAVLMFLFRILPLHCLGQKSFYRYRPILCFDRREWTWSLSRSILWRLVREWSSIWLKFWSLCYYKIIKNKAFHILYHLTAKSNPLIHIEKHLLFSFKLI